MLPEEFAPVLGAPDCTEASSRLIEGRVPSTSEVASEARVSKVAASWDHWKPDEFAGAFPLREGKPSQAFLGTERGREVSNLRRDLSARLASKW